MSQDRIASGRKQVCKDTRNNENHHMFQDRLIPLANGSLSVLSLIILVCQASDFTNLQFRNQRQLLTWMHSCSFHEFPHHHLQPPPPHDHTARAAQMQAMYRSTSNWFLEVSTSNIGCLTVYGPPQISHFSLLDDHHSQET
jgi:hypothetical protein